MYNNTQQIGHLYYNHNMVEVQLSHTITKIKHNSANHMMALTLCDLPWFDPGLSNTGFFIPNLHDYKYENLSLNIYIIKRWIIERQLG